MRVSGSLKGVVLDDDHRVPDTEGWDLHTGLLLPMANVPMVERILEGYEHAGIRETLIAAGRDTHEIASLCGNGARWNMALTFLGQPEACGSIESMKEVAAFTEDAPFLTTQGPVLLDGEAYLRAVQSHSENDPRGIRMWQSASEAPGSDDGCDGVYLLTTDVYNVLYDGSEPGVQICSFDAALNKLTARGDTVLNMALDQQPYAALTPESYLDSNLRLLDLGDLEATTPEIMADNFSSPNLVLRPPVLVDAAAELERCRIGPGVCIGPEVHVGHGAAIEHSVIMSGADIGDGASISHAVIGSNASIENRALIHGRADRVIVVRSN